MELLDTAELLLSRPGGPTHADMRRAISTIYYALFSNLSKCCADLFVGDTPEAMTKPAWMQAYRSLEHRVIFGRCGDKIVMSDFVDPGIIDFAYQIRLLQHYRFLSDYGYGFEPKLSTVRDYLSGARIAIEGFFQCAEARRREFVVSLAIKNQFHKPKAEPQRAP